MSTEPAGKTSPAIWLLPLLVVGAVLAWLLSTEPADGGAPAELPRDREAAPAELSAEDEADPTFNYGVR